MNVEWLGDDEKCGECMCNGYDKKENCYVCNNPYSENYGLMTSYEDGCENFMRKLGVW